MKCTTSIKLVLITSTLFLPACGQAPRPAAQQPCLDANGQPQKNEKGQLLNCQGQPINSTTHNHGHYYHPWYGGFWGGRWGGGSRITNSPAGHAPAGGTTPVHTTTGGTHSTSTHTTHTSGTSHTSHSSHVGGTSRSGGFGHSSHSVSS
jgi:hypothetical protein